LHALEPDPARAEIAARRCADLTRATIVAGGLDSLGETARFDLIVLVDPDVPRLTTHGGVQVGGFDALLAHLRTHLAADGVLLLALPNPHRLPQLLTDAAPMLDPSPSAQLDDGAGASHVAGLRARLRTAGFARQRWLLPHPDLLQPRILIDERVYDLPDAAERVDQWARTPEAAPFGATPARGDLRLLHARALRAGLGAAVAPAFLIVAGGAEAEPDRWLTERALAWGQSGRRRHRWRRRSIIEGDVDGRPARVRSMPIDSATAPDADDSGEIGWLQQQVTAVRPYVIGPTLEQRARDACWRRDVTALGDILRRWSGALGQREAPAGSRPAHPYQRGARAILPPAFLDVELANWIEDDSGTLHHIDDEWQAAGGLCAVLARLRALWYFARDLTSQGTRHPWSDDGLSIDQLTLRLAHHAGLEADEADLRRLHHAEAHLLTRVIGGAVDDHHAAHVQLGGRVRDPHPQDGVVDRMLSILQQSLATETQTRATLHARAEQARVDALHDRDRLLGERDRIAQAREALLSERTGLIQARDHLVHERDDLARKYEQLGQKHAALTAQHDEQQRADKAERAHQAQQHSDAVETLEDTCDALRQALAEQTPRQVDHDRLMLEHAQLREQHAQLQRERERVHEQHAQLQREHDQLERAYTQLGDAHTQLERAYAQLEDNQRQVGDAHAQLQRAYAQLEDNHGQLSDAHAQLDDERAQLRDERDQLTQARDAMREEHAHAHDDMLGEQARARDHVHKVESENVVLHAQLDALRAEHAQLRTQVQDERIRIEQLHASREALVADVARHQAERTFLTEHVAQLRAQLEDRPLPLPLADAVESNGTPASEADDEPVA
ncbi:MAG: hypothetical protein AAF772_19820, partial [Acidobacteriota bacterium]